MKKQIVTLCAVAFAVSAQAAVVLYEGFDYTSTLPTSGGTGTGFSGQWTASGTITSGSLGLPTDYGLTPVGGYASDITSQRSTNGVINLNADGVFYMSAIMSVTATGTGGTAYNFIALNGANVGSGGGGSEWFRFGNVAGTGSWGVFDSTNTVIGSVGDAAVTSQDVLFVLKIETTAGTGGDSFSFSTFAEGTSIGSEPVTWDGGGSFAPSNGAFANSSLGRIELSSGTAGIDFVDEILIGTTFADVTAVPEPSSLLLVLGGFVAVVFWRRKR